PGTGAMFSVFCAYLTLFFSRRRRYLALLVVYPLSVLLTGSGTAIVAIMVLYVFTFFYRYRTVLYLFSPILLLVVYLTMESLMSGVRGGGYVEESFGTRVSIFLEVVKNNIFMPNLFG